jgi:hypothetical protein
MAARRVVLRDLLFAPLSIDAACALWSNFISGAVAGLPTTLYTDVLPLAKGSVCIGINLSIILPCIGDAFANLLFSSRSPSIWPTINWAFYTKMSLNGAFASWLTEDNPVYIFLAALDDGMHASIIIIAGANFWPLIILNAIIAVVVRNSNWRLPPLVFRSIAAGFILIAPDFVEVTRLGWYDMGASNKLYFQAIDEAGERYTAPENFFTFYSYSFGYMDYGPPEPASAFATDEPHGGSESYKLFRAGRSCDVAALTQPGAYHWFDREKLPASIRNYHRLALKIYSKLGAFPYDVYPYHFNVPFLGERKVLPVG